MDERAALQKILASRHFAKSERLARFLEFAVRAKLESRPEDLKEAVIAAEVYGRPASYDPNIDSLVRVEASRLRSKLKAYYEDEGRADRIRLDLPRGGYAPEFVSRTFDPPSKRKINWRWLVPAGVAAAFALGTFAYKLYQTLEAERLLKQAWSLMGPGQDFTTLARNGSASGRLQQLTEALELSRAAAARDRDSLGAYHAVAHAHFLLGDYDRQMYVGMHAAAQRAVELEPNFPDAHFYLGYAAFFSYRNFAEAFRQGNRLVEIEPMKEDAYRYFIDAAIVTRQFGAAEDKLKIGERKLPNSFLTQVARINLLHHTGKFEEMERRTGALILRYPDQPAAQWLHAYALIYRRHYDGAERALRLAQKMAPLHGGTQTGWIFLYSLRGQKAETLAALAEYRSRLASDSHVPTAMALLALGNREAALNELDQAFDSGDNNLPFIGTHPMLAPLRNEPRFLALLARIGLPPVSN